MPKRKASSAAAGRVKKARQRGNDIENVKLNPFEIRSNSRKRHNVLGLRVKGEKRNVAMARAKAIEKRETSLLMEFKSKGKTNSFTDRRFGERDTEMSLEDKMFMRFQEERKRRARQSTAFNIRDDDEGEGLMLTHKGKAIDDYDIEEGRRDRGDNSDDDEDLDQEIVSKLHFSRDPSDGPEGEHVDNAQRSHKEIMAEVMAKSKAFKADKQRAKEEREELTEALDADFGSLQKLLSFRPSKNDPAADKEKTPLDDYDKITRELTFEAKARATDRTATPEEIAKKEFERLEELEKSRLARMRGESVTVKDGKFSLKEEDEAVGVGRRRTDDDLDDGFQVEGSEEEGEDGEEGEEEEGEEGSDNDEGSSADEDESEAEASDDESDNGSDFSEGLEDEPVAASEEEDEDSAEAGDFSSVGKVAKDSAGKEDYIPYIFPCPTSLEQFLATLQKYSKQPADIGVIIERIRKCNSIHLSAENRPKMNKFFAILLQYFQQQANEKMSPSTTTALDITTKHIWEISQAMPDMAVKLFQRTLQSVHNQVGQRNARTHRDLLAGKLPETSSWPTSAELFFLRLMTNVFPTSDFSHPVIAPAELLIAQILSQCPIVFLEDIARGLFCCRLHCVISSEKRTIAPEVVNFLHTVCSYFIIGQDSVTKLYEHKGLLVERLNAKLKAKVASGSLRMTEVLSEGDTQENCSKSAILTNLFSSVPALAKLYADNAAVAELLKPLQLSLKIISRSKLCPILQEEATNAFSAVTESIDECNSRREPLALQTFKPKALPSLEPKYEENYTMRKTRDPDKDKAKAKLLERQIKREKRGAMRELKRDGEFLAKAKHDKIQDAQKKKQQKQKEIWSWMQEQQATVNQQVRKGGGLLTGGGSGVKRGRKMK